MQYLRNVSRFAVAAALAAGLAAGATGAYAQSDGLPAARQQGDVTFVSGGVGLDESTAFQRSEPSWPLALRFTGKGGEFLADVHVRIVDGKGTEVLKTDARGPYMLVKVPPGPIRCRRRTRATRIPRRHGRREGRREAAFQWSAQ